MQREECKKVAEECFQFGGVEEVEEKRKREKKEKFNEKLFI